MDRKRRTLFIFLIVLGGWMLIAPLLADHLIIQRPLEKADAIVVLSGAAELGDRTREAAMLFGRGVSQKIILTNDGLHGGWDNRLKRNPTSVERARWELIELGVMEDAIEILPTVVHGTDDEAGLLVKSIAARDIKSVILVTSAYHSRRAFSSLDRAMRKGGLPLIVGVQSPPERSGVFWWLTAEGWGTIGLEWVKMAYYLIRY